MFPFWDTVLHTLNGFLAAAIGFSLVDLLNRSERTVFHLSPLFTAIVAFCFSMTIGVVWEFFEFGMDQILGFDMQKDTVVSTITSVMLNAQGRNVPVKIDQIQEVMVNGQALGLGGYLDIGLIDTMEDLFVNFIGAAVFSVIGFFYDQIQEVMVNGQALGLGGYLDIGLIDTMEDLFVNFIGAAVFSVIGFFYVRSRGKGIAGRFIPRKKSAEGDFLKIAREKSKIQSEHKKEMLSGKRG